jgi:2-methylcitrate dehydratase PrpD
LAEVTAISLAEMGYTGDVSVLDGNYGLWKFFGAKIWQPQKLLDKLGKEWHFLEICYKPYACCRIVHGALDCFMEIIEANNIAPEEIESIKILVHPMMMTPVWKNTEIASHVDAQLSVPYIFAAAAHGIPTLDWQAPATIQDSRVMDFMRKVSFDAPSDYDKDWPNNPRNHLAFAEVSARGQTFIREKSWAKGDAFPEEARMRDEELVAKFRTNASGALPPSNIDKVVKGIFKLEEESDISGLMAALKA